MSAMKPATAGAPYRVPPEPSRWPAILLAVAVHALLLAFLWFGIRWQSTEPVAVEAEVWDMKVDTAAAPPLPPEPAEPAPEPEPQVAEPPPVDTPVAPAPPDIRLEREQQRKAEQHKREREEALKKELAEEKAREQQKARELARKAAEKKKEAERIAAAEKLAKARAAAEEQKKLDKLREADLRRMAGAIGTTGSAAKATAPKSDSGYIASITAKIKSTTTYGGSTDVAGNPKAVFRVEQLPTGEIMSVKKVRSSGVPQFDDAVEKGIIKASPLPKKKDGTVERSLEVNFSMKDLD